LFRKRAFTFRADNRRDKFNAGRYKCRLDIAAPERADKTTAGQFVPEALIFWINSPQVGVEG
jgi:hypothetical protein